MKKLLVGLTLLASMSSFASSDLERLRLSNGFFEGKDYLNDAVVHLMADRYDTAWRILEQAPKDALENNENLLLDAAVRRNRVDFVDYALENNTNRNSVDSLGQTPLHLAVCKPALISALVKDKEVDVNVHDNYGQTILGETIRICKNNSTLKILLSNEDIDLNASTRFSESALDAALNNNDLRGPINGKAPYNRGIIIADILLKSELEIDKSALERALEISKK